MADFLGLMKQAAELKSKMETLQAELAEAEVTGQAGNGLVQVTMTAAGDVQAVRIDPKVVDPDDVETLQDLIVGALADASHQVTTMAQEQLGPLAGGMGGALGIPQS